MEFEKKIGYQIDFIAKDSKKKYTHGFGIPTTVLVFNEEKEPREILKIANESLDKEGSSEFEVINALPISIYIQK